MNNGTENAVPPSPPTKPFNPGAGSTYSAAIGNVDAKTMQNKGETDA